MPSPLPLDFLAVGAHPDDVEISCGGTLAVAAAQGHAVGILDLTLGELATNGTVETRAAEAAEAANVLGVALRRNAELPDGAIDSRDPGQVRRVVALFRALRPTILLTHFPRDRHPDHGEASRLVDRAWYLAGLRRYEAEGDPFRSEARYYFASRIGFEPSFVVDVTATWDAKRRAILAHRSQISREGQEARETVLNEPGFVERIETRARHYGGLIGVRYGEPFRSTEPLGFRSLEPLMRGARPQPGSFTG